MISSFKKLFSLGSVYSLGNLGQKALSFFLLPVYTAYLTPQDYGIVGLLATAIALVGKLVNAPVNSAFTRFFYNPDYEEKNGILLFNLALLALLKIAVLSLLFFLLSRFVASTLLDNQQLKYVVRIYAVILLFSPFKSLFYALLRLLEKAKYYVTVSIIGMLVRAGVVLYLLIGLKWGVMALALGNLVVTLFTILVILPVFLKQCNYSLSLGILKEPLKYAYPLLVSGYSNYAMQSGDRYVLRGFSSVSTVGLYSFGYKIAGVLNTLLIMPLKQGLQPVILKQESEPEKIRRFLKKGATYFYIIGVFIALAASIFSKEALMIIAQRKSYVQSWVIIPAIVYSYVQQGMGYFFAWGLTMAKKSYHKSFTIAIGAIVNIGLNLALIPAMGILGASLATLISWVLYNALKVYYSSKFYQTSFEWMRLSYITVVGVGLYLISQLIVQPLGLVVSVGIKIFIIIAYPLLFLVPGFLEEREKDYIAKVYRKFREEGLEGLYSSLKREKDE